MTRLLLGLFIIAFVALGLSELFGTINAGKLNNAWPGVIFVVALAIVGIALFVIKTSRTANRWGMVRGMRRRMARRERQMAKENRTPTDIPSI